MENVKKVVLIVLLTLGSVAASGPSSPQKAMGQDKESERVSPSQLAELRENLMKEGNLAALPHVSTTFWG